MERKELLKGLTNEQLEKVKNCKNNDELLALAKEEGIELTDEQLEAVSGGACSEPTERINVCPVCGSTNVVYQEDDRFSRHTYHCECVDCQHRWTVNG